MKNHLLKRVLSTVLCLCLLPVLALAESPAPTESPVTGSVFTLGVNLHADGFPQSTSRLQDWEKFLQKLSIQGTINTMDYLLPYSRVYLEGGLYVNGKNRIPFIYDGYHSYRYFISPAIKNESIHFQMHNFFEFMLKPYDYWEIPTQYIALLMYPEASQYIGDSYYTPIAEALAGDGSRTVSYDELYELCQTLDLIVNDDPHYERAYFYFTALLSQLYASDMVLEKLAELESYLDILDPEQEGMQITVSENQETYVLGETTVFEKKQVGDATFWTLNLPDLDEYALTFTYQWIPSAEGATLAAHLLVTQDGEDALSFAVDGTGLPCEGDMEGTGRVTLTLSSSDFIHAFAPLVFDFRWNIDQPALPYHLNLDIDWLHPQTQKPAVSLHYAADMKQETPAIFKEGSYPQEDFFSLNEGFLAEYKQRYMSTLGLALMPVVLEMPTGVLNDLYEFADKTGILLTLVE